MEKTIRTLEKIKAGFKKQDELSIHVCQKNKYEFTLDEDTCKRLFAAFEYAPLAIMYTDAEGIITNSNVKASELFGAPKEKLVGFSYRSIRNRRMRDAIAKALSGQRSSFEGEYLTVTGNVLTNMSAKFSPSYHEDGSVSGVIGIFEDVTERLIADRANKKQVGELQTALSKEKKPNDMIPICSSCKKIRDKKGQWINPESFFHAHFGFKFTHSICPKCSELIFDDMD
jgi:PAS domain S-box-containing protein